MKAVFIRAKTTIQILLIELSNCRLKASILAERRFPIRRQSPTELPPASFFWLAGDLDAHPCRRPQILQLVHQHCRYNT